MKLTITEYAGKHKISRSSVYRMIRKGALKVVVEDNVSFIETTDVDNNLLLGNVVGTLNSCRVSLGILNKEFSQLCNALSTMIEANNKEVHKLRPKCIETINCRGKILIHRHNNKNIIRLYVAAHDYNELAVLTTVFGNNVLYNKRLKLWSWTSIGKKALDVLSNIKDQLKKDLQWKAEAALKYYNNATLIPEEGSDDGL